jgi:hypothetical protein
MATPLVDLSFFLILHKAQWLAFSRHVTLLITVVNPLVGQLPSFISTVDS